ncbi:hypothetical protein AO1008_05272 [Aspergillus oryzae 100-8]|uniref:Uncharacterized protein n=1 Tax=Aspergillus oryzae (strain 3.042) TaxID=1160506 RepID=I8I8T2_ASPO3|nr:hypothetical protein Ao3042_10273 [Aspergillus oryzae 3.042]KDE78967.1 hypothetical protein AO1008_05272 [Aspergillus oryzae 100-8]|eukprot:EIT73471.1 hypothetical protein Ao3042_10273 [Aspergillus oryzae 3.042]
MDPLKATITLSARLDTFTTINTLFKKDPKDDDVCWVGERQTPRTSCNYKWDMLCLQRWLGYDCLLFKEISSPKQLVKERSLCLVEDVHSIFDNSIPLLSFV